MKTWKAIVVATGSALTLAACGGAAGGNAGGGGGDTGCTIKGAGAGTPTLTSNVVPDPNTVGKFVPNNMTVKVGQSIQWAWQDPSVQHTVTSDDGTTFDSCLQGQGYKFIVTFNTAGKIPYHCTIHPLMIGTITVTP